jgi:hypothetical protein
MRYARELDVVRANLCEFGDMQLIRATVAGPWDRYGIHLIDGIFSVTGCRVIGVTRLPANHFSVCLRNADGTQIQVDCVPKTVKTSRFDFWGERRREHVEVSDNFTGFRRMLVHFVGMARSGRPPHDPNITLDAMRVLIAGRKSEMERREVMLEEIVI